MAKRKLNFEDKSTSGISFTLLIPVRFNISAKKSLQDRINKFVKEYGVSKTTLTKLPILAFYNCENENKILSKYEGIRKTLNDWKNDELLNPLGLSNQTGHGESKDLSEYITEKLEIIIPLLEKKLTERRKKGKGKYVPLGELISLVNEDDEKNEKSEEKGKTHEDKK